MTKPPGLYQIGNDWQKKVYNHMSAYLQSKGIKDFGKSQNGNSYMHLLPKDKADAGMNFITHEIYRDTINRFLQHKAGDIERIKSNTCSSQAYCFNLFAYLFSHIGLANSVFSFLIGKQIDIQHIELEFTPNKRVWNGFPLIEDESIGDQSEKSGTDADVALFYEYDKDKKGVLLIEFKFIEGEFSTCSSYRSGKVGLRGVCDTHSFFRELIENGKKTEKGFLCGYKKYNNWRLTSTSQSLDILKVKNSLSCPFIGGCNQLWRNMLLAEQVAKSRECNEWGFWVLSPKYNERFLWRDGNTEIELLFRSILTPLGNAVFRKIHLEDVFQQLNVFAEADNLDWLKRMEEKYLITLE
ncbi:hypothetical protein BROC_00958 [Candidatus Brocadiaceae bacterium]|nr:hypothetical protein BROC_00958 [Candidatus Brocadiaceae bacterium]